MECTVDSRRQTCGCNDLAVVNVTLIGDNACLGCDLCEQINRIVKSCSAEAVKQPRLCQNQRACADRHHVFGVLRGLLYPFQYNCVLHCPTTARAARDEKNVHARRINERVIRKDFLTEDRIHQFRTFRDSKNFQAGLTEHFPWPCIVITSAPSKSKTATVNRRGCSLLSIFSTKSIPHSGHLPGLSNIRASAAQPHDGQT